MSRYAERPSGDPVQRRFALSVATCDTASADVSIVIGRGTATIGA